MSAVDWGLDGGSASSRDWVTSGVESWPLVWGVWVAESRVLVSESSLFGEAAISLTWELPVLG